MCVQAYYVYPDDMHANTCDDLTNREKFMYHIVLWLHNNVYYRIYP